MPLIEPDDGLWLDGEGSEVFQSIRHGMTVEELTSEIANGTGAIHREAVDLTRNTLEVLIEAGVVRVSAAPERETQADEARSR